MAEKENNNMGGADMDNSSQHTAGNQSMGHSEAQALDEMRVVAESLGQIEAILKAESKRRKNANAVTEDYIVNYLDSLEQKLQTRANA